MKICMITSFFGRHSFGGDSVYVERLCHALLRRGHEVHIAYNSGAFSLVRGSQPERKYSPPQGIFVHDIGAGMRGKIAAFWNHQTGGAGSGFQALGALLKRHTFDVIHLHNVSLLGGRTLPLLLNEQTHCIKLVTAHDYWWICPQNLFWKYGRRICEARDCTFCTLMSRRPPQLWRHRDWFNRALSTVDAVLFPSRYAMELYRSRGFVHSKQFVLPGLLSADWCAIPGADGASQRSRRRPYFVCAGRLVIEKGFQAVIPLMRQMPDVDLRIAGSGPAEDRLRRQSRGLPNVRFEGLLDHDQIRQLFRDARAIIMPSLFPETFGMVAAEAMSLNIPVIARNRGALPELVAAASGGLLFDNEAQLADYMRRIASDDSLFCKLSRAASAQIPLMWFEDAHREAYLGIIAELGIQEVKS